MLDCADGQLARATGTGSPAGARVDILVDSSIGNEMDQRSYLPMLERALERPVAR
jgi:hypothetical protein